MIEQHTAPSTGASVLVALFYTCALPDLVHASPPLAVEPLNSNQRD